MTMCINKNIITLVFTSMVSINLFAAILEKEEAEQAELSVLQDETILFQSIGLGIALSIAQCEGIDLCSLTVEESEIEELINTLDIRIGNLVSRQGEAEDPIGFDNIITAYISERDTYTTHLEKLKSMTSTLDLEGDLLDDSLDLGSDAADFPVESARNMELEELISDELELFEDNELEDDEELGDLEDLPDFEEPDTTP